MMLKNGFSLGCGALVLALFTGCASMVEMQAIEQFANAIENDDLKKLKHHSTMKFSKVALRNESSIDDLKILRIPTGETTVVNIKDVSKNHKKVVVEVGENKKKLLYDLKQVTKTGKWVVDDIYVKQKQKNLSVMKSVSEQMDLLLTVREFVSAWETGNRDDILGTTDTKFKEVLEELHPAYLARLSKNIAGEPQKSKKKKKPDAQLDKNIAIVRLPRKSGQMVISMQLEKGKWKATDVAVESKIDGKHVKSAKKQAKMLLAVSHFLDAYQQGNKDDLKKYATDQFYRGSLAFGDLTLAPLPLAADAAADYELKIESNLASFVTHAAGRMISLSLIKIESDEIDIPEKYLVEEVTLFHEQDNQQINLTSLFSARAITKLFGDALNKRDMKILEFSSTPDFSARVWKRVKPNLVQQLPIKEITGDDIKILDTKFNGAVTTVAVRQGNLPLTYILREHLGHLLVDDIQLDLKGRPSSVKETLEVMIQVQNYAYYLHEQDIRRLQRNSSRDFNEMVWRQVDQVPETAYQIPEFLMTELSSLDRNENEEYCRIQLGDNFKGAIVMMKKQYGRLVIDDITIMTDKFASQSVSMKKELRLAMAAVPGKLRQHNVQAAYTITNKEDSDTKPPVIEPAAFESPQQEP
ncbi:hypothetical protein [Gimesia aquarii]|uniref:Lipoprotein n=1 Tax=Gimesia aquarii TaxID=2527964 RepID=A0A517X0V3_9PLAN|nr:hypothetical protein [Gimesia aquarii]QDU11135.1 hypothetical protein V202x_45510 [Gimesia aquarii]